MRECDSSKERKCARRHSRIFTAASTALQALPHCRTAALLHCLAPAEAIPCGVRARTTVDLPHRLACRNARSQEICVCVSKDRRFFAPFLTPGQYGVKIELQGFRPLDRQAHAQGSASRPRTPVPSRLTLIAVLSPFFHLDVAATRGTWIVPESTTRDVRLRVGLWRSGRTRAADERPTPRLNGFRPSSLTVAVLSSKHISCRHAARVYP